MKDKYFIDEMLAKGEEAREKVKNQLSDLSLSQINWKPAPESWSVGQCLDHLVISDSLYFPSFNKIVEGNYVKTSWEKWSPLSGVFGKMLVSQIQETPRKKLKAPKIFQPSQSDIDAGIYERFHKHLDSLLEFISKSTNIDVDKVKITSPVSTMITYSLRDAYKLLIQHAHRHINQAVRVRNHNEFPN